MENTNTALHKLETIITWFAQNAKETPASLNKEIAMEQFQKIEHLLGEALPEVFKTIYQTYNGESEEGIGSFMGHSFLSLERIISNLEFAKTLVKPRERYIRYPETSQNIINQIIAMIKPTPTDWYKITGSVGPISMSGPYLYPSENTAEKERKSLNFEYAQSSQIMKVCKKLHELENENYNWDKLEFTIYADGSSEIKRIDYNFDEELPLTSTPVGAIKLKYFHIKWLPIFSDGGGNFIGLDLDPDTNGVKNQVIVFGRDEEDMYVVADTLDRFFDRCMAEISTKEKEILEGVHLHDFLR